MSLSARNANLAGASIPHRLHRATAKNGAAASAGAQFCKSHPYRHNLNPVLLRLISPRDEEVSAIPELCNHKAKTSGTAQAS
jgi:hypothetical protein